MTVARIEEDKDAKNTGTLVILMVLFAVGICIASSGNQSAEQNSSTAEKSVYEYSPVGYPR